MSTHLHSAILRERVRHVNLILAVVPHEWGRTTRMSVLPWMRALLMLTMNLQSRRVSCKHKRCHRPNERARNGATPCLSPIRGLTQDHVLCRSMPPNYRVAVMHPSQTFSGPRALPSHGRMREARCLGNTLSRMRERCQVLYNLFAPHRRPSSRQPPVQNRPTALIASTTILEPTDGPHLLNNRFRTNRRPSSHQQPH